MASREALLARECCCVAADLKPCHDARMGLPDDEMQKLTTSVTDRIPEPSYKYPLRLQLAYESAAAHSLPAGCSPAVSVRSKARLRSIVQA
jgi:hypothetical protein